MSIYGGFIFIIVCCIYELFIEISWRIFSSLSLITSSYGWSEFNIERVDPSNLSPQLVSDIGSLNSGDVIFRPLEGVPGMIGFKHFGVYIGERDVIHFTRDVTNGAGLIERVDYEIFALGRTVHIERDFSPNNSKKRFERKVTESALILYYNLNGKKSDWEIYNTDTQNCEHFTTFCATGIKYSKQTNRSSPPSGGPGSFSSSSSSSESGLVSLASNGNLSSLPSSSWIPSSFSSSNMGVDSFFSSNGGHGSYSSTNRGRGSYSSNRGSNSFSTNLGRGSYSLNRGSNSSSNRGHGSYSLTNRGRGSYSLNRGSNSSSNRGNGSYSSTNRGRGSYSSNRGSNSSSNRGNGSYSSTNRGRGSYSSNRGSNSSSNRGNGSYSSTNRGRGSYLSNGGNGSYSSSNRGRGSYSSTYWGQTHSPHQVEVAAHTPFHDWD